MSRLQIHVCNLCSLQAPSFQFASSLITAKWIFFPLSHNLGNAGSEKERKEVIVLNESLPFLFFTAPPPPLHINGATLTITNAFMCPSQWSLGKKGQLLVIKRYLFGSCGVLESPYTWHFIVILAALKNRFSSASTKT